MDTIDERGNAAMLRLRFGGWAAVGFALAGCSGSTDDVSTARDAVECTTPVAQSDGPADQHCAARDPQPVSDSSCDATAVAHGDHPMDPEQSATLYNSEGDDDDCKYHVAWAVTPACANQDAYFSLHLIRKVGGMAASGANPTVELALEDTHLAPNTSAVAVETAPGNYTIGPLVFDAPGRWTARFHMYEDCNDVLEDSPHGHVTFYVDVP